MEKDRLNDFGAYQKTNEVFEHVANGMTSLARNLLCVRLVGQQIAAADSMSAHIDEGYGHGTKKEFVKFLLNVRGSAREVRGRHIRLRRWLGAAIADGSLRTRFRSHRHPHRHGHKTPQITRPNFSLSLPQ
jgi:four helix bundle protein